MRQDVQKLRIRCVCGAELEVEDRANHDRKAWLETMADTFYEKHEACLTALDEKED